VITDKVSQILGQPLIIENRPGAGQRTGTTMIRRAPKDGYTIGVMTQASGVTTPVLDPNAGYDPLKDFTLLTLSHYASYVIVTHPSAGLRTLGDLLKFAKANPGKLNYGSTGIGASYHFWTEIFQGAAGIRMTHVPYKGEAPAMQDLLGGQIQVMFAGPLARPHVDAGKIIALAVTSPQRLAHFPGVPTVSESGVPGFVASAWLGFAAPADLPKDVADRLVAAFVEAARAPEVQARLTSIGWEVKGMSPQEFRATLVSENERFKAIAIERDIRMVE